MANCREHILMGRTPVEAYEDIVSANDMAWDVRAVCSYVFDASRGYDVGWHLFDIDEIWDLIEEIVKAGRGAK